MNSDLEYLDNTVSTSWGNFNFSYQPGNPNLKNLIVDSGTLTPKFSPDQTSYNATVGYTTGSC